MSLASNCLPAPPECNATYQFTCRDKFCKPLFWVCDSVRDCEDGSDEEGCSECGRGRAGGLCAAPRGLAAGPRVPAECLCSPGCPPNAFKCDNGKCLPQSQQCDRKDDCGDGSDEAKCQDGEAGARLPRSLNVEHDEKGCQLGENRPEGPGGEWVSLWVGGAGRRDGHQVGCPREWIASPCPPAPAVKVVTCTEHTYRCLNGLCVDKSNPQCDGKADCTDGSDEKDCGEQGCCVRLCGLFTEQGAYRGRSHTRASLTQLCPGERMCLPGGKDDFAAWHPGAASPAALILEARPRAASMSGLCGQAAVLG